MFNWKAIVKAAKPAVEIVELAGAALAVGSATREYAPKAWDFILATVGVKNAPPTLPPTAGAIDIHEDDHDDCALATSEVVLACGEDCGCERCKGGAPAPAPAPTPTPAPPVSAPPKCKPCSLSRASTPPKAADSPTGKWVWIGGAWYPGIGWECKGGCWQPYKATITPRHPTETPVPLAPLRGAEVIDVCPGCVTEPIFADGAQIRIVPCDLHDTMARANAAHLESLTLGWAQSWEIGESPAMPKIDDPKYTGIWGKFKADDYISDMRAYHASITPGASVPVGVRPDMLAKVAIYALGRQGKRYADEAVATRELMSSASADELSTLQSQLATIDKSRDRVDALLAKLKYPDVSEAGDVQTLATDIVAAASTKGGLDRLFQKINSAVPPEAPVVAPPLVLNPGVVPPSVPGSGPIVAPPMMAGAIDYDGPSFDDAFCVDDVADALGLPPAAGPDDLDVLCDARQELTDDDLAALGAQMAAVDLGCATGTCGLPTE